jgi:hypothetical protein
MFTSVEVESQQSILNGITGNMYIILNYVCSFYLSLGTFCSWGCFVYRLFYSWGVCSLGHFVADIHLCVGRFIF